MVLREAVVLAPHAERAATREAPRAHEKAPVHVAAEDTLLILSEQIHLRYCAVAAKRPRRAPGQLLSCSGGGRALGCVEGGGGGGCAGAGGGLFTVLPRRCVGSSP